MKKIFNLIILLIITGQVTLTCQYSTYSKSGKKWHRRVYREKPIKFFRKKRKDRYVTESIAMNLNPNQNSEEVFFLDLNKIKWNEYILNIEAAGFYDSNNEYSEILTNATKFYLVKSNNIDKNIAELDMNSGKFKYIKKLVNKDKLALKIVYDTGLINGKWYNVKSGAYNNKISFFIEEKKKNKKNDSYSRRRSS